MPYVSVYVDAREAFHALDDEELEQELAQRRAKREKRSTSELDALLEEVEYLLLSGRSDEALLHVQRWLRPKFRDLPQCLIALQTAKETAVRS